MPSRVIPPSPPPFHRDHNISVSSHSFPSVAAAGFASLLLFTFCFRKISRKRTVPSDSRPPHHFSYSSLRRATNSFSPALLLGKGGFGSVFRGTLSNGQTVAVKVMDSGSLQGEREFQNELLFASKLDSPYLITALGFSSDRKHRTMLLVYELMPHGNLQDALLLRKCPELALWKKRFDLAVEIARGIEYLHSLVPPVVHGDIKPSNVLLDQCFSARVADFGLAWLNIESNQCPKNDNQCVVKVEDDNMEKINGGLELKNADFESCSWAVDDYGSVIETESLTTGFEEFNLGIDQSPDTFVTGQVCVTSPEPVSASPETGGAGLFQEAEVKDHVMEWIGSEINKDKPKNDWIVSSSTSNQQAKETDKKPNRKRFNWWTSLEDDEKILKKAKRRPPREWWKEEYCEELEKKKKKKKKKKQRQETGLNNDHIEEEWWPRDEHLYVDRKKKRSKSRSRRRSSRGSIDWFSQDSMSGGISSTPSMRGTVCYAAPEYGGCGDGGTLSEKSDVYSFGVLLLVLVSGRRPLQVTTSSPMSEFKRANLIHWARSLARAGKLIDLVDQSIECLDQEQAVLCITVALLCLQKSPDRRPSMYEVVGMLTGKSGAPNLPVEFSPSPPSRFPFKSRSKRKAR
ncbi:hypothetical protein K2173_008625 [Erythroxylum novogranatense]|uniref:Protein kinase domain-containing protein n=1 Tax=Erythroxylum novogranatense TaxID=1862640 RepID=A0AAV8SKY6_9ROSI|nr:hypothetical protein K2173_008625 [Erythroxylum novogranatense]